MNAKENLSWLFAMIIIAVSAVIGTNVYNEWDKVEPLVQQQPNLVYDCEQTIVRAEQLPNKLNLYTVVCIGEPSIKYFLVSEFEYPIGQSIGIEPADTTVIDEEYDDVPINPQLI